MHVNSLGAREFLQCAGIPSVQGNSFGSRKKNSQFKQIHSVQGNFFRAWKLLMSMELRSPRGCLRQGWNSNTPRKFPYHTKSPVVYRRFLLRVVSYHHDALSHARLSHARLSHVTLSHVTLSRVTTHSPQIHVYPVYQGFNPLTLNHTQPYRFLPRPSRRERIHWMYEDLTYF